VIGRAPDARPPLLIGREGELARLWHHFASSATGYTGVVLRAGEPGIGKTRLLDALTERASQAGATVLRGVASEAEGMPPYLPFLEALGQHIRTASPEVLREQAGALAPFWRRSCLN
jgi:predicted ATPase